MLQQLHRTRLLIGQDQIERVQNLHRTADAKKPCELHADLSRFKSLNRALRHPGPFRESRLRQVASKALALQAFTQLPKHRLICHGRFNLHSRQKWRITTTMTKHFVRYDEMAINRLYWRFTRLLRLLLVFYGEIPYFP